MLRFDIETDGLLDTITKIHCMVISDGTTYTRYKPNEVEAGVRRLQAAIDSGEKIAGHNIIDFDIPAIQKLFSWFSIPYEKQGLVVDTLVLGRLIYSNIKAIDYGLFKKGIIPGELIGTFKLKAWGYRLGILKGTYGEQEDAWDKYSDEMLEYCVQDVVVTDALLAKLDVPYSERAIELEHKAQWLMSQQTRNGFPFNKAAALELERTLRGRAATLEGKLVAVVPPIPGKVFIPKRDNKTKGYVAGVPIQRYKEFNPNSRQQIEWILRTHYGYAPDYEDLYNIPKDFEGEIDLAKFPLKMEEETFEYIKNDEEASEELRALAAVFSEYLMVSKRLGQLADGKEAWFNHIKADGFIHGYVNPNGAVTGRATHSKPNVAQVPASKAPYGHECRALFGVPEGWVQVGVDACGLELRCLSHFMYPYDNGVYAHEVVNGDVHTVNQLAAGLALRDDAKTFIYAFLYGAGDAKIGKIVKGTKKDGKRLKRDFLAKTPAIADLKDAVVNTLIAKQSGRKGQKTVWKRRYLKGLDGRIVHIRSPHSALNALLQSAGAVICKYWIVRTEERLIAKGLRHGWDGDFAYMAWVHDEFQAAVRPEYAALVVEEAQAAMRDTQEYFKFKVQLDTEGKVGKNWSDCH